MQPASTISPPLLRRAYQLARSGACKDLSDISRRLKLEGYCPKTVDETLEAKPIVRADLTRILIAADET